MVEVVPGGLLALWHSKRLKKQKLPGFIPQNIPVPRQYTNVEISAPRNDVSGDLATKVDKFSAPSRFRENWIIAFPVHAAALSGPDHWSLGILVNELYNASRQNQDKQWILFHFDSFPGCNENSKPNAIEIAKFIIDAKSIDVEFVEVPVPMQSPISNDCGLFPAHFLRIFLRNPDLSIKVCKVGIHYNCASKENK
jgi:hypothetical protein